MNKLYSRIQWENYPSEKTPLNESNLNKIDNAVDALDDRAIEIDTKKLDLMTANTMVKDVGVNSSNGVITVTYLNGAKATFDTNLEKIALNFTYDAATQRIILTLTDGTKQYIDLSALITEYEFEDSSTVAFEMVAGKVRAKVKNGSITGDMLRPDYLADITVQAQKALQSANDSGTQAEASRAAAVRSEEAAKKAEDITGVSIATNDKAGIIKGNADEFTVAADGKLSLTSSFTAQSALASITGTEDKKTLFGKLAKCVSSLISHIADKAVHFTLTNNLLATAAGTALDAAQGKALDDKIADVNRKLGSIEVSTMRYKQALTAAVVNKVGDPTPYVGNTSAGTSIGLSEGWYAIMYLPHASADGYGVQVVFPYTAADVPKWRVCHNGTWYAWQAI